MYGITETTVHVSYYPVTKADSLSSQSSTIGKVIPDLQAFVLDENKQQVPIGVIGELYIGGPGLAQGYLHRPELTEERFIQNPFYKDSNEKLYRTGDLVRLNPDGNFEYIGRADQQVKIRGFRIELGEIEYQLMKYEGIQDAKVTVREDIPGDKRLVAYVISDKEVLYDEVKAFLSKHLPDYMVPAYIVEIESFPLTPNGKLDYRSLPQPDYNFKRSEFVKPRNATELTVAQVWSDVLNVEKIGVMDSFFELGGHSLLATQVVTRLSEEFQIELPIQVIFEKPKLEQLASHIDHVVAVGTDEGNEIKKVERTEPIPLSFAQQRMWFIDRLTSSSNLYNLSFAWDIKGDLSVDALEKSLNEVIRRHESLRTTIYEEDGRAYQNISPYKKQDIPVIDLSSLEDNEKRMKVDRMVKEEADKEFDLEKGPVLRVKLFKLSEKEFVLSCVMHHIVSDGWSMGVFLKEWFTLYREAVGEGKANLPPLPFQYADFAVWQKEWLNDEVLEQQLMYWKDELSGELPVLQLPLDYKRPAVQTYNGAVHKFKISKSLLNKLKQVGRMEDATLYMVLLAAYQGFLYKYTGQEDIVIGSPIANRTNSKIEGLIGFFVNTLPYRVQINSDMNFKELLAIVREKAIQGYSNQDVPFEKIVDEVAPGRDATYSSLFQTLFVLQNAPDFEIALEGLEFQELEIQRTTSKFDLSLIVEEKSGELEAEFEYNTDLFEEQRIERLSKQFINWLNNIADNSDKVLGDIQILTEEETKQMLVDWNDTAREYPREKTIHELFEEQVSLKPDGIALETEDGAVTYRELNESANQIAHYLIEQGIEIGDPIGICMNRSLEEIASMLGILKVGGAYVGLDPEYPEERLKHIVEETEMPLLLTTSQSGLDEAAYDVDIVNIDLLDLPEEKTNIFREGISATALSNIIYTSGSTGKPKGVCVPHRGVVRLVKGETYVPITSDDVFLHVASISFDATTLEVWSSLLNGARLVLLPTRNASLQDYENVIQKHNVSILWLTAGLFNVFVDHNLQALKGVKYLLIGGETVSVPHVRKAMEALEGTEIINGYGPSENTVFTTCHRIEEADLERPSIPIGRPIANTEVYVLDENQQPVPVGVIGELYAGGDGLAIGYMNRPELTAERFIPHPFKQGSGEKLYRTGDLVRYLPDGKIEFIGRADHQVKIRGFRIELGEIEVVLKQYPDVRDAVVTTFEDGTGDKKLIAYLITDGVVEDREIREYTQGRLPNYMIPWKFMFLSEFPLTKNGKVDRKSLPIPFDRPSESYVEPKTKLERKFVELWERVLGRKNVGTHDNFFELGGHSLLATKLVFVINEELGYNITLRQLFEKPTIVGMIQSLENKTEERSMEEILKKDIFLDKEIDKQIQQAKRVNTRFNSILLTGATGFLGAYMLRDLLNETDATIYCLVRGKGYEDGFNRIKNNLMKYALWDERYKQQIIPLIGDLSQDSLGLSVDTWRELENKIDMIYHTGADVNFMMPYEESKYTNVYGTKEIIRLASSKKIKPIHYVSTLSVFTLSPDGESMLVSEDMEPRVNEGLSIGYTQSKCVAENVITLARNKGLPISIYRPGRISGDSTTGRVNESDLLWRLVRGCIELGKAPEMDGNEVEMTPVDMISKSIICLSVDESTQNGTFHLFNNNKISFESITQEMKSQYASLEVVGIAEWLEALEADARKQSKNAMSPLVHLLKEGILEAEAIQFENSKTMDQLEKYGITYPKPTRKMIKKSIQYFSETGVLQNVEQV